MVFEQKKLAAENPGRSPIGRRLVNITDNGDRTIKTFTGKLRHVGAGEIGIKLLILFDFVAPRKRVY